MRDTRRRRMLDVDVARSFVDMPLVWRRDSASVDRERVRAALEAVASGAAPEATESHHELRGPVNADWHARRIAYFIRRPGGIRNVVLYIDARGHARIQDGRHRYGAALYLGMRRIPDCVVIGTGAERYKALSDRRDT